MLLPTMAVYSGNIFITELPASGGSALDKRSIVLIMVHTYLCFQKGGIYFKF